MNHLTLKLMQIKEILHIKKGMHNMKDITIIDPNIPQWKGNLHMHTNRSYDCDFDYHDAIRMYREKGFHFCLISDHEVYWDSTELDSKDFCVLSGMETAFNPSQARNYLVNRSDETSMHFNIIKDVTRTDAPKGFTHDQGMMRPVDYGLDSWNRHVQWMRDRGHIVMLNHPSWSILSPELMMGIHGCFAFEIYNTSSVLQCGCNDDEENWDYCLKRGKFIYAAAGDDTHEYVGAGVCGHSFNMVSAPELNAASLVTALKAGHFYPSTGPVIYEMRIVNGELYLRFSPARSLRIIGCLDHATGYARDNGETFTEFSWKIDEKLRYFRVTITDPNGGIAWSQPVMMADLNDEPRFVSTYKIRPIYKVSMD